MPVVIMVKVIKVIGFGLVENRYIGKNAVGQQTFK